VVLLGAVLLVGAAISIQLRAGVGEVFGGDLVRRAQDAAPTWLEDLCKRMDVLGGVVFVGILRIGTLVVLAAYRRWRHAVVYIATSCSPTGWCWSCSASRDRSRQASSR
jgi:hypothetical protein